MLMFILIAVAVVFLFYYRVVKPLSYWKDRGVKQGNPKWIVGDNLGLVLKKQNAIENMEMVYQQCPGTRYSGIYQFSVPTLLVKDPELIKQITVKDFDHFTDHRTVFPEDAESIWSRNLFALRGQKWRDMRTILSPSFTSSKMRSMFILMVECAENFVQHFLDENEDVVSIKLKDTFTRFTNDMIASTAFGIKVDSLAEPNNPFYLKGKDVTDFTSLAKNLRFMAFFMFPKLCQLLNIKIFSDDVTDFFKEIVSDTIKTRKEKGIVRPDMIHLLMEARKGNQQNDDTEIIDTGYSTAKESTNILLAKSKPVKDLSEIDVVAQAMIFFLAGFDSVSTLMCFTTYELAANPDIQDRLRQEVMTTLDECGGKITYEGLLKMKYLDMVVSEVLRKWPSTLATDRLCLKPYTINPALPDEQPLHLEEGSILMIPIYGMHHDQEYFPNPDRFDPDRFNDENKDNIKPYTYFPFGLGPRNCIGSRFALLENKVLMFYILMYFEIVPVERSRIPVQLSKTSINLTAEGGFWFGLKRLKR